MTFKALRNPLAGRIRPAAESSRNPAFVLAIILGCYLMIILDISVVITALPSIHQDLGLSTTGLSWVQNAYTLTFGGLLLLGARAGDILGRRQVFVAGIALFTFASMLGGIAQSPAWLLSARALQGIGAAIAAPSTLALLTVSFAEGPARTRAVAWYSAVAGAGGSVGLLLGGALTSWVSWRAGLFINVPLGAALIWLAPRYLPETERRAGHFDLPGALSSTIGMTALVYGLIRAAENGWGDAGSLASFALAAVLLVFFVANERRAQQPITPLRLFSSRERVGAYVARIMVVGAMYSTFFFLTQYLQGVQGYGALAAGSAFLPMTLSVFAMVRVVPRIMPRVGEARVLAAGLAIPARNALAGPDLPRRRLPDPDGGAADPARDRHGLSAHSANHRWHGWRRRCRCRRCLRPDQRRPPARRHPGGRRPDHRLRRRQRWRRSPRARRRRPHGPYRLRGPDRFLPGHRPRRHAPPPDPRQGRPGGGGGMRSRGTTATPPRSTRDRPAETERGDGGKRVERRRKGPVAPQHSTFRRVAVFVPLIPKTENNSDRPASATKVEAPRPRSL